MEKLTLLEVLEKLKDEGFEITKRTFMFYQRLGLLPTPEKRIRKRRGVYGYYDYQTILDLVRFIYKKKEEGLTLAEIQEVTGDLLFKKYESVLDKWEVYYPPKLETSSALNGIDRKILETVLETQELAEIKRVYMRKKIIEDLRWWDPDEKIELYALKYIYDRVSAFTGGLSIALNRIDSLVSALASNIINSSVSALPSKDNVDKVTIAVLYATFQNLDIAYYDLIIVSVKAGARIAEISKKEFMGLTKEQWEMLVKNCSKIRKESEKPLYEKESNKRSSNDRKKATT